VKGPARVAVAGGVLVLAVAVGAIAVRLADPLPPATFTAGEVLGVTGLTIPATEAMLVTAADDSSTLFEQRADESRPLGSVTKIITALVALERLPLAPGEDGPTHTPDDVDLATYRNLGLDGAVVMPINPAVPLSERQLLEAMLVSSSANHAIMLSRLATGSPEDYREAAAEWLIRHGFHATTIVDAAGLSELNRSTPRELIGIATLALANPVIAEVVQLTHVDIPAVGVRAATNPVLGEPGVDGMKTGTTETAGHCLVFTAVLPDADGESVRVIGVVLGAATADARRDHALAGLALAREVLGRDPPPASTPVGDLSSGWGEAVPVSAVGLPVGAWSVSTAQLAVRPGGIGEVVSTLVVHSARGPVEVELVALEPLPGPDPWWRLFRPSPEVSG
jgi:D-alanyl-D-alanine carboxypeptidase (penicillin-binding protein 5/6)